MAGKGDTPRPFSVDRKAFHESYMRTFEKLSKESTDKCLVCGETFEEACDVPQCPYFEEYTYEYTV